MSSAFLCKSGQQITMKRLVLIVLFNFFSIAQISAAQQSASQKQIWVDSWGNIFVRSNGGYIQVADARHCGMEASTQDQQTLVCQVAEPVKNDSGTEIPPVPAIHRLEIFQTGSVQWSIEPEAPILEWHLWDHDRYVAVHWGTEDQGTYSLYELATTRMTQTVPEPQNKSTLPPWAKDRGQLEDESVPTGKAAAEERMQWLAKVMREIQQIKPGMKREDLWKTFTTEGGISNRFQRTFVYAECPYIKVDVRFKAVNDPENALKEDPEDIIESISKPYLEWSVMD